MSALNPNFYDILGLPQNASPDEIKRRYRELARRYHPDVSLTPDAPTRFREINEANSTLSDAQKRATYDAKLKLDELKRNPSTPPRPRSAPTNAPPKSQPSRPFPQRAEPSATRAGAPKTGNAGTKPSPDSVEGILTEARKALYKLRYRDAELLCRRANRIRRTSASFELLGDIFRARGRADDAIAMYSYAIQLDRTNRNLQLKFDKLVGQPSGPTMAGSAARASRGARIDGGSVAPARALITGIGSVAVAFLVVIAGRINPPPATDPWFIRWDPLLIFALALTGAAAGFISGVNAVIAPAREDVFSSPNGDRKYDIPLGAILGALSIMLVYAAFLVYVAVGFVQGRLSRSLLTAFGAVLLITVVFSLTCRASGTFILISGGNLVFLGFLAGWRASDSARR